MANNELNPINKSLILGGIEVIVPVNPRLTSFGNGETVPTNKASITTPHSRELVEELVGAEALKYKGIATYARRGTNGDALSAVTDGRSDIALVNRLPYEGHPNEAGLIVLATLNRDGELGMKKPIYVVGRKMVALGEE